MSGQPRILLVADAGARVGGGHVMRSLTLARSLADRGAACVFVAAPAVRAVLDAFGPGVDFIGAPSTEPARLVAAAATAVQDFDAVVFDHYGLSAADHRAIAGGRPALVIDDLADRPLAADLVLDSGPARLAIDYDGLVPPQAELLLGPAYAPVRPAFSDLRQAALARRAAAGPVRRILVSLGLTDVGAITGRVVDLMLPIATDAALDVVLGSAAPSLPGLTRLAEHEPRLVLHVDSQAMARLTLEADLAVGGGGSTSWERCVLALPSLLLVLADNQRAAAAALAEAGAVVALDVAASDFETEFPTQLARLLHRPTPRERLSAAAATVCDGQGAGRAAARFLAKIAKAGHGPQGGREASGGSDPR